jgi:hypothetical protein
MADTLTPAFSNTAPCWSTRVVPPPPPGRAHTSWRKRAPAGPSRSSIARQMASCRSRTSASMRPRIVPSSAIIDLA